MAFRTLDSIGDVHGKVALVRVDFNVPMHEGSVADATRIRASAPTILELADAGAKVLLLTHYGRPKGERNSTMSTSVILDGVQDVLGREVMYVSELSGPVVEQTLGILRPGDIGLLENTRFWPGEEKNDPEFARAIAANADLYVNDAFSAAHRAHASTEGVARLLPSCAGMLLERELHVLGTLLAAPERPFVVLLGGAKVSDKIEVIRNLLQVADTLLIGGAMAFTFAKAAGGRIGDSLVEDDKLELARDLVRDADERGVPLLLPDDVVCASAIEAGVATAVHPLGDVPDGLKGLDIGPATIARFERAVADARTILWNGPMGVFEVPPFDAGTRALAQAVAASSGMSVVGGGDSVAALNALALADRVGHVSTGGGASLEFLEGRSLPGVAALGSVPWR
jgi:phosphoglycerate kinase